MKQPNQLARSRSFEASATVSALALTLGLAACSANATTTPSIEPRATSHSPRTAENTPLAAATTASTPTDRPIFLVANMSGFLKPGRTDTCFNGGRRPCAVLLRTKPSINPSISDYINAAPTQGEVKWPYETYKSQPGDKLEVLCYDRNGEKIGSYEDNLLSSDWCKVVVPELRVLNPAVRAELEEHNPDIATIQQAGQTAIAGWASITWFNQQTPNLRLPAC